MSWRVKHYVMMTKHRLRRHLSLSLLLASKVEPIFAFVFVFSFVFVVVFVFVWWWRRVWASLAFAGVGPEVESLSLSVAMSSCLGEEASLYAHPRSAKWHFGNTWSKSESFQPFCLVVLNQEGRSSRCTRDSFKALRHGSLLCEHRRQGRARGRGWGGGGGRRGGRGGRGGGWPHAQPAQLQHVASCVSFSTVTNLSEMLRTETSLTFPTSVYICSIGLCYTRALT